MVIPSFRGIVSALILSSGLYHSATETNVTEWTDFAWVTAEQLATSVNNIIERSFNVSGTSSNDRLASEGTFNKKLETEIEKRVNVETKRRVDVEVLKMLETMKRNEAQKNVNITSEPESDKTTPEIGRVNPDSSGSEYSYEWLFSLLVTEIGMFLLGLALSKAIQFRQDGRHVKEIAALKANLKSSGLENEKLAEESRAHCAKVDETRLELLNMQQNLSKVKAINRQMTIEERHNYPIPNHLFSYLRQVNVCVTGPSGGGKSSLINSLLTRCEDDPDAAPVGWVETTKKPVPFTHPEFPNIVLWDCPGVGTRNFPADTYVRDIGLKHFACVLIVSSTRFTENDHLLRSELERVGLPYFCLRSKFDQDLDNLKKQLNRCMSRGLSRGFSTEFNRDSSIETTTTLDEVPSDVWKVKLEEIKKDLREEQNIKTPYVLAAHEKHLYDFPFFLKEFHARLNQFSKHRKPSLCCEVCSSEEDPMNRPLLSCTYCRYFICSACADIVPSCETCPNCNRAALYRPLGESKTDVYDDGGSPKVDLQATLCDDEGVGAREGFPLPQTPSCGRIDDDEGMKTREDVVMFHEDESMGITKTKLSVDDMEELIQKDV